jgi:tyrosinase
LDAEPQNPSSTRVYDSEIFQPDTDFGGNGVKDESTPEQNFLNLTGGTDRDCVQTGPFAPDKFMVNYPGPSSCLRRDFMPPLLNTWTDPNLHGSGHFGVGGVLGQAGDPASSPGGPLFYLHHANPDRIYWKWQQQDLETRLREVGGPIVAEDYLGKNVTLDFEVDIGKLVPSRKLKDLIHTQEGPFCYTY